MASIARLSRSSRSRRSSNAILVRWGGEQLASSCSEASARGLGAVLGAGARSATRRIRWPRLLQLAN